MKYIFSIIFLVLFSCQVLSDISGKVYFSKGFTERQRSIFKECYKLDDSFIKQDKELTVKGDILIYAMHTQNTGYLFRLKSNAYGRWMDYIPMNCDTRTEQQKQDAYKQEEIRKIDRIEAEKKRKYQSQVKVKKAKDKAKKDAEKRESKAKKDAEIAEIKAREKEKKRKIKLDEYEKKMTRDRKMKEQVHACMKKAEDEANTALKELNKSRFWSGSRDDYKIEDSSIIAIHKIWYNRSHSQLERSVVCDLVLSQ